MLGTRIWEIFFPLNHQKWGRIKTINLLHVRQGFWYLSSLCMKAIFSEKTFELKKYRTNINMDGRWNSQYRCEVINHLTKKIITLFLLPACWADTLKFLEIQRKPCVKQWKIQKNYIHVVLILLHSFVVQSSSVLSFFPPRFTDKRSILRQRKMLWVRVVLIPQDVHVFVFPRITLAR